jgi:sec-independent protein translocase protein TatB
MFDIGFWELLVIGILALLILGPDRLPGAIRSTARTIRSVKGMAASFKTEIDEQLRIHELHENLKKAESMKMQNLSPELQQSVDELKAAANSVQTPYKQSKQHTDTSEKEEDGRSNQ